jgi:hypothetical protein
MLKDFESYLDSMTGRRSFFAVNLGVGTGYFSFNEKNNVKTSSEKKLIFSPSVGYYHKSGLGLSAIGYGIFEDGVLNMYQAAISPSFDIIKRGFSTGISYTKYITKDSLNFYSTPIQNELFAYFSYKKWWLRPAINFSYGWGSKEELSEMRMNWLARLLSGRNDYWLRVRNSQKVRDFSTTFSLRKDFDWYSVFGAKDNITFTPVAMLNAGTQNFGFNTSYSFNRSSLLRANSLPSNREISANTQFGMQSTSMVFRGSYFSGKFMVQSQVLFDYFLQELDEDDSRLNTVFSVMAGVTF